MTKKTQTYQFGSSKREGHDASLFYGREIYKSLPIPVLSKKELLEQPITAIEEWQEKVNQVYCHSSETMYEIPDNAVGLAFTSPPYNVGKEYDEDLSFEEYLALIERVGREVYRVLVPGGRLVVVVGDVALPRRKHGRHEVVPLHADIQLMARELGFENLAPIIWSKIANVSREVPGNGFLGKPYQPNAIVKLDFEFILMFRKPGYRTVDSVTRLLSTIPEPKFKEWLTSIWNIPGESTKQHPAPFPLSLTERIVRLFSFVGDVVLDPFVGTGTTMIASAKWGRNSVGIDIDPDFVEYAKKRFLKETSTLFSHAKLRVFSRSNTTVEGP